MIVASAGSADGAADAAAALLLLLLLEEEEDAELLVAVCAKHVAFFGFGVMHLKHLSLCAKTVARHAGQVQSLPPEDEPPPPLPLLFPPPFPPPLLPLSSRLITFGGGAVCTLFGMRLSRRLGPSASFAAFAAASASAAFFCNSAGLPATLSRPIGDVYEAHDDAMQQRCRGT